MSTDRDTSRGSTDVAWRDQCAARIAAELARDPSQGRLAKASSLLHAFRSPGVHVEAHHVRQALEQRGVTVHVPGPEISRRHVLELCADGASVAAYDASDSRGIRVSRWAPGRPGLEWMALSKLTQDTRRSDEILWFDVDPVSGTPGTDVQHTRIREVTEDLTPWCEELDEAIVADLLTPDPHPKIETYGDERTGVRSVSMAAIIARETPDDDDDFDGVDERLIIQLVEVICGPGWLLTCWHPSRVLGGRGNVDADGPSLLREPFVSHVAYRWVHDDGPGEAAGGKQAADLALYLARSLVATYGASLRMLQRWVATWEVGYYKTLSDDHGGKQLKAAADEISDFLSMVAEFARSVTAFKLAGEEMPNKTWFPESGQAAASTSGDEEGVQARTLAASVEAAESKLSQLSQEIRADMDLLMIQSQARQQESSERLQGYLGKVTGLVLVPTFVAGLFGANTALPGGGSWMGFDIMLLLMAVSAAVSYFIIRRIMVS